MVMDGIEGFKYLLRFVSYSYNVLAVPTPVSKVSKTRIWNQPILKPRIGF